MLEKLKEYENLLGYKYPDAYLKVVELKLLDFDNWFLMGFEQLVDRRDELIKRYPNRNLIPFAGRYDSDDIACFEMDFGEKVFIVHDYATEGYERRQEFDNFWLWFISAIKELIGIE